MNSTSTVQYPIALPYSYVSTREDAARYLNHCLEPLGIEVIITPGGMVLIRSGAMETRWIITKRTRRNWDIPESIGSMEEHIKFVMLLFRSIHIRTRWSGKNVLIIPLPPDNKSHPDEEYSSTGAIWIRF